MIKIIMILKRIISANFLKRIFFIYLSANQLLRLTANKGFYEL